LPRLLGERAEPAGKIDQRERAVADHDVVALLAAVELEVWSVPSESVGAFTRQIPAPLGLGSVALADGSSVLGFLCESYATDGAKDDTKSPPNI
jgi:hypothetical protein